MIRLASLRSALLIAPKFAAPNAGVTFVKAPASCLVLPAEASGSKPLPCGDR